MVKAVGPFPWPRRCGQSLGGVAKAVGGGQGLGGVAKAVGAWPKPCGRGQGLGGLAKAVRANPYPIPKAVEEYPRPWGHG